MSITSSVRNGHYRVEVADNGPGIDSADRQRIFEKFSRGSAAARSDSGSGLGLAISRQIILRMDGSLDLVASETGRAFCRHFAAIAVNTV